MAEPHIVRVGSRKSELALFQTRYVISLLKDLYPNITFEIKTMTTLGDRVLNISLPKIGEKSLFTRDLEEALTNNSIDMVVHSLKDLPTALPDGMAIGAVLEREDPRDALVLREDFKGHTLATLPPGSIIGTSSLRRTAQLLRNCPHLKVADVRGNLNTRLKKLDSNCKNESNNLCENGNGSTHLDSKIEELKKIEPCPNYVGLILAQAGLLRMGWNSRISEVLPSDEVLYAVGQGALAIECKADSVDILKMLAPLNHMETYCRILAERSFLKTLGGGCSAPVAVSTTLYENEADEMNNSRKFEITGAVWSLDGTSHIQDFITESISLPITTNKKRKIDDSCTVRPEQKKVKICNSKTCPNNSNGNANTANCEAKRIHDTMKNAEPMEIENLINAHGKLFTSCPYTSTDSGHCPFKLPIGQEFMGSCPYFDEEAENLNNELVKLHPKRSDYDIKKCPFMSNQVVAMAASGEPNGSAAICTNPASKAQKCPFLKKTSNVKLYCGLTKHCQIPENIIEKCETLGYDLAQSLIKDGALEVMHSAQQKIRGTL